MSSSAARRRVRWAGQSAGVFDVFAGKCDSSGNLLWLAQRGSTEIEYGFDELHGGVASDIFGNVYVVGRTKGSLDGNANLGGYDAVPGEVRAQRELAVDPAGWHGQQTTPPAPSPPIPPAMSMSPVMCSGDFSLASRGWARSDVFISKYDPAGTRLWSVLFGSVGPDEAFGLTCDADRNVIVTGWC